MTGQRSWKVLFCNHNGNAEQFPIEERASSLPGRHCPTADRLSVFVAMAQ